MKESGIEWVGKIPQHWKEKRLKYVVNINKNSLTEDTDPKYEFYYVDISNASENSDITNPKKLIFENAPSRARRLTEKNDTIISTVRTYLKIFSFVENNLGGKLIVSTGFAVLHPSSKLYPKFLFYIIESEPFIQKVVSESKGVVYPAMNSSELGNIVVWYPEIQEQEQIVKFIENEIAKIDNTLLKIEKEIALLQEYKTALISEAVTGKIDVREAT
jgi:type I restriction enzyme S subunit